MKNCVWVFAGENKFQSSDALWKFVYSNGKEGEVVPSPFSLEVGLQSYEHRFIFAWRSKLAKPLPDRLEGALYAERWPPQVESTVKANELVFLYSPNLPLTPERSSLPYIGKYEFEDPKAPYRRYLKYMHDVIHADPGMTELIKWLENYYNPIPDRSAANMAVNDLIPRCLSHDNAKEVFELLATAPGPINEVFWEDVDRSPRNDKEWEMFTIIGNHAFTGDLIAIKKREAKRAVEIARQFRDVAK